MKCTCGDNPSFFCSCKSDNQYFCESCVILHMKDKTASHNLVSVCVETGKEKIISKFNQTKEKIRVFREQVLKDLSISINLMQARAKSVLKSLNMTEKNLEFLIQGLHNSEDFSEMPRISKTLLLDPDSAEIECNQWELWNSELSGFRIEEIIDSWVYINDNLIAYLQKNLENQDTIIFLPEEIQMETSIFQSVRNCPEGHDLLWSNQSLFENFFSKNSFFCTCKLCDCDFSKSGWYCKTCKYDVCEDCASANGNFPPKLQCPNSHELQLKHDLTTFYKSLNQTTAKKGSICDICTKLMLTSAWHCTNCKYEICLPCARILGFTHPSVCPKQHLLIETEILKSFSDHEKIYCQECRVVLRDTIYVCEKCLYSMCSWCKNNQEITIPNHPVICCAEFHLLKWSSSRNICNLCKENCIGNFKCKDCKFFICSICSDLLEMIFRNSFEGISQCQHTIEYRLLNLNMMKNRNVQCITCTKIFDDKCGIFLCEVCDIFYCIRCYSGNERIIRKIDEGNVPRKKGTSSVIKLGRPLFRRLKKK